MTPPPITITSGLFGHSRSDGLSRSDAEAKRIVRRRHQPQVAVDEGPAGDGRNDDSLRPLDSRPRRPCRRSDSCRQTWPSAVCRRRPGRRASRWFPCRRASGRTGRRGKARSCGVGDAGIARRADEFDVVDRRAVVAGDPLRFESLRMRNVIRVNSATSSMQWPLGAREKNQLPPQATSPTNSPIPALVPDSLCDDSCGRFRPTPRRWARV